MYKILIVDDEKGIREGMRYLLNWEDFGVEIIGEASNGKEALDLTLIYKPHIIITDIRMPLMDGLEFIKEIHTRQIQARIIILSGYDDFSYVREAMKYGAENYLLKPINQDELTISIKEIIESLERNLYSEMHKRESMLVLRNNTLSRVIRNEISLKELDEKLEFLGINLNYNFMQIAVIELDISIDHSPSHAENQWKRFASLNICEELVLAKTNGLVFMNPSGHIIIIFRTQDSESEGLTIQTVLFECMETMKKIVKINYFAAVGNEVKTHRELNQSYQQALGSLDYKLVLGLNKIAYYKDILLHKTIGGFPEFLKLETVKDLARACKKNELVVYIHESFDDLLRQAQDITPSQFRDIAMEIILCLLNVAKEVSPNDYQRADLYEYTLMLHKVSDVDELKIKMEKIVDRLIEMIQKNKFRKYSKIVNEAINYVNENYSSADISLKTLSNQLNINAAYLGRMFKDETGGFFSDFLCKIRLDKAKELLVQTDIRIQDISLKVGFSNTNYFYTIFKKNTGMNPGEFREV